MMDFGIRRETNLSNGIGAAVEQFGLGTASGDLDSMASTISAADGFVAGVQLDQAVATYQQAGQYGATVLGPEIDAQTNGASQGVTHQAWLTNATLAAVNSSGATVADAQNAETLAKQMYALYVQGLAMPPAPAGGGGAGTVTSDLANAAQALLASTGSAATRAFQTAYNAAGFTPQLSVDGIYGPKTQAALQQVLDMAGAGIAPPAPAPSGGGVTATPRPAPAPAPIVVAAAGPGMSSTMKWVLGGLLAVAALGIGWMLYTGKKRKASRQRPAWLVSHRHHAHEARRRPKKRRRTKKKA